jgi:hypothetical protein
MAHRPSARLRRVEDIRLKFAGTGVAELPLGPGMHAIGHDGDGTIGVVDEQQPALVRFNVDRRGIWLTVDDAAHGVHVNGRPVRRMAMLRVGDCIYVDEVELVLVAGTPPPTVPAKLGNAPVDIISDPRIVLRGVGGHYHGRSFTLERPRLVGRSTDADIRIDDSTFADRHARIDLQGDVIVLRDLGSATGSVVNGAVVRDAVLKPGDQVVFDAHHRFVIEAPARAPQHDLPPALDESRESGRRVAAIDPSARRLPWLLLAALLIAGALSALLLFGVSA